jgi:hypothetical protein
MKKHLAVAVAFSASLMGCMTESEETKIVFRNRTASIYNAIFITACANTSWGSNRLNGAVIMPNGDRSFDVEPGCWDVRGETTNDKYVEFSAIEVTSGKYEVTATN